MDDKLSLEGITKEAIKLIIEDNSTKGRHGTLLTQKQKEDLIGEFYRFLNQSIKIKAMGQNPTGFRQQYTN